MKKLANPTFDVNLYGINIVELVMFKLCIVVKLADKAKLFQDFCGFEKG